MDRGPGGRVRHDTHRGARSGGALAREASVHGVYDPTKALDSLPGFIRDVARAAGPTGSHAIAVIGYHAGGTLDPAFVQALSARSGLPSAVMLAVYEAIEVAPFWVVQSSWGTGWGRNGYGFIAAGAPSTSSSTTRCTG
ncbi:MAG TPA: C1 family peptidase [Myxococcota bacterium]|nr:C1 family peptidase [Myxococcota bacterium]